VVLTLQLRLLPTAHQSAQLRATMRAFNAAATYAARVGFEAGLRSQPSIHRLTYYDLREQFGLSSQMAVRAIGKAVECFARDKTVCPVFRPDGAMTYDPRLMSFKGVDTVSLLTLDGRELVPLIYGEYQRERFDRMKGQVDLVLRDGRFYLYASITVPDGAPIEPTDFLGVDMGIVNLATDSDGTTYTGAAVEKVRRRHHKTRRRLQRKGTRGAKKQLKALAGREGRFRRHLNHCISKQLVTTAQDTQRGIALEDLTHIRSRTTVRRKQRARHAGWAFFQLRAFVEYKAQLAGVRVVAVDPRNTSRTCSQCGHCEKANRKSQSEFRCLHCDYSALADFNAARNLSGLGRLVTPPQTCQLAAAS
jgi:IS605 OrfB family transposase